MDDDGSKDNLTDRQIALLFNLLRQDSPDGIGLRSTGITRRTPPLLEYCILAYKIKTGKAGEF